MFSSALTIEQEGISGEVILHDDDPELVDKMLRWCYSREYDASSGTYPYYDNKRLDEEKRCERLETDLVGHVNVYALADKYGIQALKEVVAIKFCAALPGVWNLQVKPQFVDLNVKVAEVLYKTTPSTDCGLRNILLDFLEKDNSYFAKNEQFLKLSKSGLA